MKFKLDFLVLLWTINLLFCELFLIQFYLFNCKFPLISYQQINVILVADPQLTDEYSYKQHGILLKLTEFYCDIYMKRNFRKIISKFNPSVVIFVGDLMDGGREWKKDQFNEELERLKNIFQYDYEKITTLGVAGNHDIGFGMTIVEDAYTRYLNTFGSANSVVIIADHAFVALDTIALSGNPSVTSYQQAFNFLEEMQHFNHDYQKRILLTHVPLYRPENSDCGNKRHFGPIKNQYGYQYQSNLILIKMKYNQKLPIK